MSRFRLLGQKLALNEVGNILAVTFAAMSTVIHQAFFDQFSGSRISGLLQITGDFFYLRLFRGKGRGQLHDPVQREEIRRLLQSFLDHADLEEEIAVDITLCMEQIAELPLSLIHI